jgi:hypothetical protein
MKTELEIIKEREAAMKLREEKERQARLRKDRMRELEKLATLKAKLTDEEVARLAKEQAIREAAAAKIDENHDVVKALYSMSCRATAFTMRENQLSEKKVREVKDKKWDQRMDVMMEIDRLKDIQKRDEEEREKRLKRVEDRKVITEQMEQRQKLKFLAAEARQQENHAMRALMKKYEQEEKVANEKRKVEIEKSRLEVVAANEAAIARKEEAKWLEKKEVEDILMYQAMQDAKFAAREAEEAAIERAKKERQAKLLDQQERAQNNADKLDEIRARRAFEERERKARFAEKQAVAKRKADMDELLRSRAAQAADKHKRAEEAKERAKREHFAEIQRLEGTAVREQQEAKAKHDSAYNHRTMLLKQIDDIERTRQMSRQRKQNEGTEFRQETIKDEAKLSAYRDRMVADLESQGVNPRYLAEMKTFDIGKFLRR